MKFMSWGPSDLGYRAALTRHVDAIIDLMHEEAERD